MTQAAKIPTCQNEISFSVSDADRALIDKIVKRVVATAKGYGIKLIPLDVRMDITAVHANGNPLRLADLLAADDFNLGHDVFGIERHLNRETGQLMNFFSPRFTARQAKAA